MKRQTIIFFGMILLVGIVIAQGAGLFNVSVDVQIRQTIENDFGSIHIDDIKCVQGDCHGWVFDESNETVGVFQFRTGATDQETRINIQDNVAQWMEMYHESKSRVDETTKLDGGNVVISDG